MLLELSYIGSKLNTKSERMNDMVRNITTLPVIPRLISIKILILVFGFSHFEKVNGYR